MPELNTRTNPLDKKQIQDAIKTLKNGKAAGIDKIKEEMINESQEVAVWKLEELFGKIWELKEIPQERKKGKITLISKKEDLKDCNNWRGVTLLSMLEKVFTKIVMNMLKEGIDARLRKELQGPDIYIEKCSGTIDRFEID